MKFYSLLFSFTLISFIKVQAACGPTDFTASDTCSNTPASFVASGGDATSIYTWDFGDPASLGNNIATGASPNHFYASPGPYTVTLTITGTCAGTISKIVNITQPPASLTVDINDVLVCTVPFNYTATGTGATYLWSNGQTGPSTSISDAGRYWVKTSLLGCSFADTAKVGVWGQGNKGDYKWTFGNGGFDFSGTPAPASLAGTVFGSGSSSISTPGGTLLFYTDGQAIYNKNNIPFNNGFGLSGNSPTQPALIVPDPRSNNIYYVFTSNSTTGLSYSVVDMSLNGGLGDATEINIPLDPSATAGSLAGLSDSAGGFWTTTYDPASNQMMAYKINNTGLVITPVSSSSGIPPSAGPGSLKFSSDGTKAALALPGSNLVVVYNFNRATGLFSNPVQINTPTPLSVAFAPDNSKLYVDGNQNLFQYDMTSLATPPLVINTGKNYADMVLGPDGRIYISEGGGAMGIINDPTFAGAQSNYKDTVTGVVNNPYLPNFISNYFISKSWGIAYADTCSNSPTLFQFTAPDSVTNWTWSFDGTPDPQVNFPGNQTTQHTFTTPGPHTVSIHVNHHCGFKDMSGVITIVQTPVVNLSPTITVCIAGDSAKLDATNPNSTYVWSTGETTPVIYAKAAGTFSVVVTSGSCTGTGSSNVTFLNQVKPNLGNDTTLCFGQTLNLTPGSYPTATSIVWTGAVSTTAPGVPASASGQYMVAVNFAACTIKDTINVRVIPQLIVNLGLDDTLCVGASKSIGIPDVHSGLSKYVWYTAGNPGSVLGNSSFLTVNTSGDYVLLDSMNRCIAADTVHIEILTQALTVNLGATDVFCVNSFQNLDAGNTGVPGVKYLWTPNGATTRQTTFSSGLQGPVTYSVEVSVGKGGASGGCKVTGSVTYTYVTPPVINLGPNSTYCQGQSVVLYADPLNSHPGFDFLWSPFGQQTPTITASATATYSVVGKDGSCFSVPASVDLIFKPTAATSLPPQITFCKDKDTSIVILLNGASPGYTYQWSPAPVGGGTGSSLTVTDEGVYSVLVSYNGCDQYPKPSINVISICEPHLFVPTAFSPNGDNNNEIFQIYGEDIAQYDFRIFDRWGELIFVSTDLSQSWDGYYKGKIVEEGVYVWKVTYYGKTENGLSKHIKEGNVTVIK